MLDIPWFCSQRLSEIVAQAFDLIRGFVTFGFVKVLPSWWPFISKMGGKVASKPLIACETGALNLAFGFFEIEGKVWSLRG